MTGRNFEMDKLHSERRLLTVTEITRAIQATLEHEFPRAWVQGEISNFRQHTSGHLYFTLKDESAQISGVMWRGRTRQLTFAPADGMKVVVRGSISVYPPRGSYQIDCEEIQPLGVGELQMAFERLKKKLSAEGLFDAEHKRPIPPYPEKLAIVTSETGAAFQDILSVLSRRMPAVEVLLMPVRVQGIGAAAEIADGIRSVNAMTDADVMIVGRGGGSLEDLWAFNEEVVARAIYESRIPVVSAVGHEIDFSIADLVADLRAPTPSAAAELVVRDRREILEFVRNISYTVRDSVLAQIHTLRERIQSLVSSYAFNKPRDSVRELAQRVDELDRQMTSRVSHFHQFTRHRLDNAFSQLEALSPAGVLNRGYVMVRKDGVYVSRARELHPGDFAELRFHDGDVPAAVRKKP